MINEIYNRCPTVERVFNNDPGELLHWLLSKQNPGVSCDEEVTMRTIAALSINRIYRKILLRARLVDYLFPMSRPTLFLGPTLVFFFTFRPTLSRGAFFSSENCILNEINKKKV